MSNEYEPAELDVRERMGIADALAVLIVAVLFTNFANYGALFLWTGIQPIHVVGVIAAIASPFVLLRSALPIRPSAGLILWAVAFATLCLVYFVAEAGADPEILRRRILASLILVLAYSLFVSSPMAATWAGRSMLLCVLVAAVMNVIDITHPFLFVPSTSEFANLGRAAGLYMNANQSGAALILGFALTVGSIRSNARPWFALIVLAGVVLTLSRAAIAGWLLVMVMLGLYRVLKIRDLVMVGVAIMIGSWIVWHFALPAISDQLGFDIEPLARRLFWFLEDGASADFSGDERRYLAAKGWEQFSDSPLVGNGLGSTETWSERSSTHNLYLLLMSDFGVLGALILPGLVLAATSYARGPTRGMVATVGGFVLFWGLFSHNVLSEPFTLVAIALAAAMREHSGWLPAGNSDRGRYPSDLSVRRLSKVSGSREFL